MTLPKPKIEPVPLAAGLRWRGGRDYHYAEKVDGEFSIEESAGCIVAGERMPNGLFFAFNVAQAWGENVMHRTFRERLAILDGWTAMGPAWDCPWQPHWRRPAAGNGGEFLETVLARDGEGVIASHWGAPWGAMQFKCKRAETHFCRVTGLDTIRGSAELADAATGQERGKLALRGRFERVRVGSVLKVEAFGVTARGMLREARLDRDTPESWLVTSDL
jgi:ATP-dependent DNA ligase